MWRQHSSVPTTVSTARVGGPRTAATHAEWANKLVKKTLSPNVWYVEKMAEDCRDEKDDVCREENHVRGQHFLEPLPLARENENVEDDDVNTASWVQALLEEPVEVSMEEDEMSQDSQDNEDFELFDDVSVLTVDSSMESLDWEPSPVWLVEESPFDLDEHDIQDQHMREDIQYDSFEQATEDADLMSFLLAMCP